MFAAGASALLAVSAGLSAVAAEPETPAQVQPSTQTLSLEGLPGVWLQGAPVKEWEKDKVYIFEFWATWCGPCLAAMPHMEQLHQAFKDNPRLQIVGVNVMDRKSPEALKEFLKARPTALNYAMAVDVDGKTTSEKWLKPLDVNGIPHAFVVKNGQLIWRGHPSGLSKDLLDKMIAPGFSAAAVKPGNSSKRELELFMQKTEELLKLLENNRLPEAMSFIKQVEDSGDLPQDRLMSLKRTPFMVLVKQGKFQEAQNSLCALAAEYPDNYNVQMRVAGDILLAGDIPWDKMDVAAVEKCLQRCIDISRKENKEAYGPWSMLAKIRDKQGNSKEAREYMLKAVSLSSLGKAWQELQVKADGTESLQSVLDQIAKDLKPVSKRNKQEMGDVVEDTLYTPLFNKLDWVNHAALKGLPAGKTVIIDFWRTGRLGEAWPSKTLDIVLKKYGLLDDPNVKVVALALAPLSKEDSGKTLGKLEQQTVYPIGIPKDESVMQLLLTQKIQSLPAAIVVRDGVLLWAGEVRRMPEWVADVARQDSLTKEQLVNMLKEREAFNDKMQVVVTKAFDLRKQKKTQEYIQQMLDHADEFAKDGWFSSNVAEIKASQAARNNDYQQASDILDQHMARFPLDDACASYTLKMLNSSDEIKACSYKARRHALQIMRDANTRGDDGYNAACYEVMMKMAMEEKAYQQAREDGLKGLRDHPLVREYAELIKK